MATSKPGGFPASPEGAAGRRPDRARSPPGSHHVQELAPGWSLMEPWLIHDRAERVNAAMRVAEVDR